MKAISDDAFEGRGPGTVTGEAAADWIAEDLKELGVAPANNGSYFQTVPAVSITLRRAQSQFAFSTPKGKLTPKFADDAVYWTPQFAGTGCRGEEFRSGVCRLWRGRAGI